MRQEIKHEIKKLCEQNKKHIPTISSQVISFATTQKRISRIGEIPIYATDSLVRRALPLQKAQVNVQGECEVVRLHPETAHRLGLQENDTVHVKQQMAEITLPLLLDEHIAIDAAWIAGGIAVSPKGATVAPSRTSAPLGLALSQPFFQGLSPLAIDGRPVGAKLQSRT